MYIYVFFSTRILFSREAVLAQVLEMESGEPLPKRARTEMLERWDDWSQNWPGYTRWQVLICMYWAKRRRVLAHIYIYIYGQTYDLTIYIYML